ncbi:unnamed protein product [Staurois parvus]|uniref:Uncharacterized protein n=1 Tax=Staurois parvus TaxID=386267 RepID=A0ABN9AZV5_9NEOB|nr:unnamed protein product [Staurois parvus]
MYILAIPLRQVTSGITSAQGQTDNSWSPRAFGDYGAPVSLPTQTQKSL